MDRIALARSPIGRLVPISGTDRRTGDTYSDYAYLPDPLPALVELSAATWTAVAAAEAALARLDEAARQIPEPRLVRQPSLRREAQSTSALEGTFAPLEEVLGSEVEERAALPVELREVVNYVVAAEEGFAWARDRPLTTTAICGLQQTLVRGTPGEHSDSGRVRDRQVVIGPRGAPIAEARFIPPPPGDQLRAGFERLLAWIADPPADMPATVQAALAHYQFETLHPFSDGNGRIGRLLIVLQLMRRGILREPILVVSPWFEERRNEYQDALLELSRTGRWDDWVRFFATGVGASADSTRDRIERLLAWREAALERVRAAGVSGVAERVADEIIGTPVLRARQVAVRHAVTPQGAMTALRRLAALGIVAERRHRGRVVFAADDVIALLRD